MAAKFREKAKDFRKSLMRFFCLCSAAGPMEEYREAEGRLRFTTRSDIDVPAQSEEVREMYEFIERALTFRRRDLPVFQPSQNPTLPPPLFTPHFTPGAVFEPNRAISTHGFPAGRALA